MNNPLGVNREPHEAKKKSFDLGGNRTHDLRIRSTGRFRVVNRGEEKVRVHMNVVPRSTGNTNSGTNINSNAQWIIHGFK